MATGLGSVDVAKLVAAWGNGDASTTTLSADSTKVGAGDTVKFTAAIKGGGELGQERRDLTAGVRWNQ